MEVAGVIGRSSSAFGLVRRSLSFSLPGKQFVNEALPIFGSTQPIAVSAVSRGSNSGGVRQTLNALAMDGAVDTIVMQSPRTSFTSPLERAPTLAANPSQKIVETFLLRPGSFAWPQIETEEAEKRGRFGAESISILSPSRTSYWGRVETGQGRSRVTIVGHRGSGKNKSKRLAWVGGVEGLPDIRENTIRSFALAGNHGADFIEFDVQVSKDSHAVIFHDDYIHTSEEESRRIGDLTIDEFRRIGPQEGAGFSGRPLLRRAGDGILEPWECAMEGPLCTLKEAFQNVAETVGFNIEVKFLDSEESLEEIARVVTATLADVKANAGHRRIIFSTFHPDAAILLRRLQSTYPVFFLTDGGSDLYQDPRRNSLAAAIDLCTSNQLQGIVSEVTAILRQPEMIRVIKNQGLGLYTYGEENNLPEAVFFQQFQGVDGVIVDNVRPVANLARSFSVLSAPVSSIPKPQLEQSPVVAALNEVVRNAVAIRAA
ncbi:hypothetical protein KFL_005120060 [Klebsormidium nitens]|uniref:glycerophosphodiester phosphodiesterase n=1 Tax=Klebsormidium nitens TaxID=105231 RepID=A0A1Y1IEE7_KLENI|nr:hypothetical protein KFL_005120060 [Klebsormidium nitens]|eukprot:GAQ89335.1 hypothetical protein KFL_005120060 [Klebsormidium nitens]